MTELFTGQAVLGYLFVACIPTAIIAYAFGRMHGKNDAARKGVQESKNMRNRLEKHGHV